MFSQTNITCPLLRTRNSSLLLKSYLLKCNKSGCNLFLPIYELLLIIKSQYFYETYLINWNK